MLPRTSIDQRPSTFWASGHYHYILPLPGPVLLWTGEIGRLKQVKWKKDTSSLSKQHVSTSTGAGPGVLGFPPFPEAHGNRKLILLVIISNIFLFALMPRIGNETRNY